jgi:hypothetical protein
MGLMRNVHNVLVGKYEEKRLLERHSLDGYVKCINLTDDRNHYQDHIDMIMTLLVP